MKKKSTKFFKVMTAMIVLTTVMAFSAYAGSSWRPDNSGIYASQGSTFTDGVRNAISRLVRGVTGLFSDVLGVLLSPFVKSLGDSIYMLLITGGCSLDAVIFGRVGGASYMNGNVAMFTYELTEGNIYGIISMYLYNILSGTFLVIMVCVVVYRLVALLFYGYESRLVNSLKRTLGQAVLYTAAIFLMPKLIDLLLYLRDLVLYAIATNGIGGIARLLGAPDFAADITHDIGTFINPGGAVLYKVLGPTGNCSLVNIYRDAAVGNLMNAVMYLATTILTLYFAVIYVSTALTFGVLMVLFPVCCILDIARGDTKLKDWFTQILGLAMIPVIDGVLLLFPITLAILNRESTAGSFTFIQLVLMMSIIPAREFVRSRLGFGSSTGMERAGLSAGIAALRLAGAVKAAAGKAIAENRIRKRAEGAAESVAEGTAQRVSQAEKRGAGAVEGLQKKIDDRFGSQNDDYGVAEAVGYKPDDLMENEEQMEASGDSVTVRNSKRYQKAKQAQENADSAIAKLDRMKSENASEIQKVSEQISGLEQRKKDLEADKEGNKPELDAVSSALEDRKAELGRLREKGRVIREQSAAYGDVSREAVNAMRTLENFGGNADLEALGEADDAMTLERYRDNPRALENCSLEKQAQLTADYADFVKAARKRAKVAGWASPAVLGVLGAGMGSMTGAAGAAWGASLGMDAGTALSGEISDGDIEAYNTGRNKQMMIGSVPPAVGGFSGTPYTPGLTERLLGSERQNIGKYGDAARAEISDRATFERDALSTAGVWARASHYRNVDGMRLDAKAVLSEGIDGAFEGVGAIVSDPSLNFQQKEERITLSLRESFRRSIAGNRNLQASLDGIGLDAATREAFYDSTAERFVASSQNFIQSAARTDGYSLSDPCIAERAASGAEISLEGYGRRNPGVKAARIYNDSIGRNSVRLAAETAYRRAVETVRTRSFGEKSLADRKHEVITAMRDGFSESMQRNDELRNAFEGEGISGGAIGKSFAVMENEFISASGEYVNALAGNQYAYSVTGEGIGELKNMLPSSIRYTGASVSRAAAKEIVAEIPADVARYADTAYSISGGRLRTDRALSSYRKEERLSSLVDYAGKSFTDMLENNQKVRHILDRYEEEYGISADEVLGYMAGQFKGSSLMFFKNVINGGLNLDDNVTNSFVSANRDGVESIHGPADVLNLWSS